MPPRKRARAVAVSSPFDTASSSSPTVVLRQSEGTATNEALAKLSTFRRGGKFSDVTVRAGGVDFPGHRVVLASGSDYLDALFSAGMSDSQSAVVTIDDVPPSVLEAVLDFIYDGRCSIPEQALPSILEAAARLQVPSLQAIVIDEITSRLSPENSLAFWTVGERFTLPGLVAAATDAAATRFADLASSEALLEASHSQLLALFQCERLVVDEEVVFNALRRWSDHAQPAPAELYTLLAHVRFGCMSAAFLKDDVRSWAPMQLAEAKDLLLDALMPLCTTPATVNHLKRRVPQSRISWRTFDENMLATIGPSGQTRIERQDARRWDVALGEGAMTNGVHRWSVCVPNFECDAAPAPPAAISLHISYLPPCACIRVHTCT